MMFEGSEDELAVDSKIKKIGLRSNTGIIIQDFNFS